MKKFILALVAAILATTTMARPSYNYQYRRYGDGPVRAHHHYRHVRHYHHGGHYHGSFWGRGGRNFWPGFIGGVVGATVVNAVTQPSVVVTTPQVVAPQVVTTPVVTQPVVTQPAPVYQPTQVWVPGQWVYTTGPYGTVRTWQPGHYEVR